MLRFIQSFVSRLKSPAGLIVAGVAALALFYGTLYSAEYGSSDRFDSMGTTIGTSRLHSAITGLNDFIGNPEIMIGVQLDTILLHGMAEDEKERSRAEELTLAMVRDYRPLLPRRLHVLNLIKIKDQPAPASNRIIRLDVQWLRITPGTRHHANKQITEGPNLPPSLAMTFGAKTPLHIEVIRTATITASSGSSSTLNLDGLFSARNSETPWSSGQLTVTQKIQAPRSDLIDLEFGIKASPEAMAQGTSLTVRSGQSAPAFVIVRTPKTLLDSAALRAPAAQLSKGEAFVLLFTPQLLTSSAYQTSYLRDALNAEAGVDEDHKN